MLIGRITTAREAAPRWGQACVYFCGAGFLQTSRLFHLSRLNLGSQYWSSRAIAVFDVNDGGSTRARISARLLEPWHGGSWPSPHDVARGVHTNVHDSERIKTLYGSLLTGEKMTMLTGGACQLTGFPDLLS
jgi:hypothetical protein